MTEGLRHSLGMLCIAAMALVVSLATAGGDAPGLSDGTRVVAIVAALAGFAMLAVTLLKKDQQ